MRSKLAAVAFLATLLAGCATPSSAPAPGSIASDRNGDGVVVVAVLDFNLDPYHWDFLSAYLPQHRDADPANDLPLDADPATWLPRFPGPSAFASYTALNLSLTPHDGSALAADLRRADNATWDRLKPSTPEAVHYTYVPGTKVVGLVDFLGDGAFAPDSHGLGSATVSVGNLHGACPECLLVFVNGAGDRVVEWVAAQDWIDVQTNSWHSNTVGGACTPDALPVVQCQRVDDGVHGGADLAARRAGVERGQAVFWAAGNGLRNDFQVPMLTYSSDQKGNDWTINVGAINAEGYSYTGHFKPVHIANVGTDYPRGGGPNVAAEGKFSGTSNATPVTAGLYAKALYDLRKAMGSAAVQEGGTLARGSVPCGAARPACATADGNLTLSELREALFRSANYTVQGNAFGGLAELPGAASRTELTYLSEGHGSLWGRYKGTAAWQAEVARITGYATGQWHTAQPPAQKAWFEVDSMCRQALWGAWDLGYYHAEVTKLPEPSSDWPVRSALVASCPMGGPAVAQAVQAVGAVPVPLA